MAFAVAATRCLSDKKEEISRPTILTIRIAPKLRQMLARRFVRALSAIFLLHGRRQSCPKHACTRMHLRMPWFIQAGRSRAGHQNCCGHTCTRSSCFTVILRYHVRYNLGILLVLKALTTICSCTMSVTGQKMQVRPGMHARSHDASRHVRCASGGRQAPQRDVQGRRAFLASSLGGIALFSSELSPSHIN